VPSSKSYDSLVHELNIPRAPIRKPGLRSITDTIHSKTHQAGPDEEKYTWNLEGRKILEAAYVPYVAAEHKPAEPPVINQVPATNSKGTQLFEVRIIEKTEKTVKAQLEHTAHEVT
jgi:hypothetical protein